MTGRVTSRIHNLHTKNFTEQDQFLVSDYNLTINLFFMRKNKQAEMTSQDNILSILVDGFLLDFVDSTNRVFFISGDSGYGKSLLASKINLFTDFKVIHVDDYSSVVGDEWICDVSKILAKINKHDKVFVEGTCSNYVDLVSRCDAFGMLMPLVSPSTYRSAMAFKAENLVYGTWGDEWIRKSKISDRQFYRNFKSLFEAYRAEFGLVVYVVHMPWYGKVTRGWH